MRYLSVCSGIEAASSAWTPLGWSPVAFSEIEPFPCGVLAHHYPDTPNWGDMTKWKEWPDAAVDVLVGGTPCQSFSTAGQRAGMDDPRGQLALSYTDIARRYKPRWVIWENVPGVLSSGGGRDFSSFIQSLVECGYSCAWRVLDARYFGVAQRRRRVFVVGHINPGCAAAVLFDRKSLCRDIKEGGKEGEKTSSNVGKNIAVCCDDDLRKKELIPTYGTWWDGGQTSQTLDAVLSKGQMMPEKNRFPVVLMANHEAPIVAKAFVAAEARRSGTITLSDQTPTLTSQTKRGDTEPCVLSFSSNMSEPDVQDNVSPPVKVGGKGGNHPAVAFENNRRDGIRFYGDQTNTIQAFAGTGGGNEPNVFIPTSQIRRLTPEECELLQGFPINHTRIPWRNKGAEVCPDGPRYKSIGNSMAVPVVRWIGQRILEVESIVGSSGEVAASSV